jgi:hypothetical protein
MASYYDGIMSDFLWDAFISHASEDKETFVIPLVEELQKFGIKVWFDKFTLRVGSSLRRSIEEGLANSRFGVVVLSPSFLAKEWSQSELDGLFARQMDGKDVILPVWHQISKDELLKIVPMLADKWATNSNNGVSSVAKDLVRVIRPEAFEISTSKKDAHMAGSRLVDQLRQRHPGLDFRVSCGPVLNIPFAAEEHRDKPAKDGMSIQAFVNDLEVYNKNPIRASFTTQGRGTEKMLEFIRTGKPQEIGPEELVDFRSTFGDFTSGETVVGGKLFLRSAAKKRKVPAKLVFGSGENAIAYPYIEFETERVGVKEGALVAGGASVGFKMTVVIPFNGTPTADVNVEEIAAGADVHVAHKFSRAWKALRETGKLNVTWLAIDSSFTLDLTLPSPTPQEEKRARIIEDAVSVADFFAVDLTLPAELSPEDVEGLCELKTIMEGGAIGSGGQLEANIMRDAHNFDTVKKLQSPGILGLERSGNDVPITVFGRAIDIGPHLLTVEDFQVVDFEATEKRFAEAPIGTIVPIKLEIHGAVRIRLRRESNLSLAAE